jgi:hypothetical protein
MDRINLKKFRFICPLFADEFVGSQALECFGSKVEVPLDLSISPWMLDLGKTMFNATFSTNTIKDVLRGVAITGAVRKLDVVICCTVWIL